MNIRLLIAVVSVVFASTPTVWAQDDEQDQVDENESVLEEVIVQGYRSSIEKAADIKREADTVVEAITVVEMGQFIDDSIAGALQRIAGVKIETDPAGTDGTAWRFGDWVHSL